MMQEFIVVLLAAGKSSRTTKMKQLYVTHGEYLINRQIERVKSYGYRVVVVLGHEYERVKSVLKEDVEVIKNEKYEEGMLSSVKVAFKALRAKKLIFCHIDRPIVSKEVFEALVHQDAKIVTTFFNEKKAPPICIDYSMKEELLETTLHRLDYWIESTNRASLLEVDDAKVHYNANRDADLERYFG